VDESTTIEQIALLATRQPCALLVVVEDARQQERVVAKLQASTFARWPLARDLGVLANGSTITLVRATDGNAVSKVAGLLIDHAFILAPVAAHIRREVAARLLGRSRQLYEVSP
jgi:hypothetical protein